MQLRKDFWYTSKTLNFTFFNPTPDDFENISCNTYGTDTFKVQRLV